LARENGKKATLSKLLEACHNADKGGEIIFQLSKQLPKITELTVCSTSKVITGGVFNVACSKTLAEAKRAPVSYLCSRKYMVLTSVKHEVILNECDIDK
jgi:hypothetical protein